MGLARGVLAPRNPMVGSFPACCARAASGHARRAAEQRDEVASFHCPMPPRFRPKDSTP